jgi:UDP-N-acetylglucosamine 4-epimerase
MSVGATRYEAVREQLLAEPKVWLITGVAGFVGSNLLQELLELGQTVVGVDNFSTGYTANLDQVLEAIRRAGHAERFRLIRGDVREPTICRRACEGIDYVLHHAALGSVARSIEDPVTTSAVNVQGFLNILLAARDSGVRRVVYASSSSVYGDAAISPQTEDRSGRPMSPYAASKAAAEQYALAFHAGFGLETVGLRYFNLFGRRQDAQGAYAAVIPRWIAHLIADERCHIFGDGETSRDFCYVANAVQANLLAALGRERTSGEVYNVACGQETSLNDLFRMVRLGLSGYEPRVASAQPLYGAARNGDIRRSIADITKAREQLGYEPTQSIAQGLGQAIEWYVLRSSLGRMKAPVMETTLGIAVR